MRPPGPLRKVIKASLFAKAVLCAVVAGALLASGCGSAPGQVPTARRPVTSTVRALGVVLRRRDRRQLRHGHVAGRGDRARHRRRGRHVQLDRVRAADRRQPLRLGPGHAGPARATAAGELVHPAGAGALPPRGEDRVDTRPTSCRTTPAWPWTPRDTSGAGATTAAASSAWATPRTYLRPVRLPLRQVTAAGRGQQPCAVRRRRHRLRVRPERGRRPRRRQHAQQPPPRSGWPGCHGSPVTRLVASFANSGALLSDGKYFDWGYNGSGQLGDGHAGRPSDVPVRVHLPHPVTAGRPGRVASGTTGRRWCCCPTARCAPGAMTAPTSWATGGPARQPSPVRIHAAGRRDLPEPGHRVGHVVRGDHDRARCTRGGSATSARSATGAPAPHDLGAGRLRRHVDLRDREQRGHQRAPQDVMPRPVPSGRPAVSARPPRPALA